MLQGATHTPQQCYLASAPTSFIWCQLRIAVMPLEQRTKGRDNLPAQKCQTKFTLPNQFNGVIVKTQKCLDIVAPRERSLFYRSNAKVTTPLPINYRGTPHARRDAINRTPPSNLGHIGSAFMSFSSRPITRGHPSYAVMPPLLRLAT